jgi:hypothetical protein
VSSDDAMNKHYEMFILNYNALNHYDNGQSRNEIEATVHKIIVKGTAPQIQAMIQEQLKPTVDNCIKTLISQNKLELNANNQYTITSTGINYLIKEGQPILQELQELLPIWFGEIDGSQTDNDGFWTVIAEYYNYFFIDIPKLENHL